MIDIWVYLCYTSAILFLSAKYIIDITIEKETKSMTTYPVKDLMNQWETERLTMEQIIGHILQHISALEEQIKDLQRQLYKLSSNKKVC